VDRNSPFNFLIKKYDYMQFNYADGCGKNIKMFFEKKINYTFPPVFIRMAFGNRVAKF
jgi:hypothetical protein